MSRSSTALGKLLVLLAFGGVCGYFYHGDAVDRRREIAATTPLEPTGTGIFPAGLAPDWPLWGDITLFVVLVLVFFGLYEALGAGVGWVIFRRRE